MPLVNMKDMLHHAHAHGYAVGAFEVVSLDFLQGILNAAERCRSPVILSLAETHSGYFDFELLLPAVEQAAKRATVPVTIHLNHGTSLNSAVRAINLGCTGVMVDSSDQPFEENRQQTRHVVKMAHGCGIPVEGKPGDVTGETHDISVEDIQTYVEQTGVDFLAVSIGTEEGRLRGRSLELAFERLARINRALGIPLALHDDAGLNDGHYERLIENGAAKINCYTALSDAAAAAIRDNRGKAGRYPGLLEGVTDAVVREVEHRMQLWNCTGRADELLAHCEPWLPVEHLIIYNVKGLDEAGVAHMMAEGHRVLSAIPGVRELTTGEAVKLDAAYRYTWLVRFCHPAVIDSYREHPAHVAFADNLFRPVAAGRVSIDYQAVAPPLPGNKTEA